MNLVPISILAASFVNQAFFVAGAAMVAIPILIHILNRRRFKTVNWAAMEFLLRAMRKNRRRLKFEQWLLLAVRCLVLLLAGMALARPLGCQNKPIASLAGQRNGLHVIVVDNSYSMAYEADRPDAKTHLEQAKLLAKAQVDRLFAGGESVALVTASSPAAAVVQRPNYDLQSIKASIDRVEQSSAGTDLAALQLALEIGQEDKQPVKHLYLFTDATRSAWDTPRAEAVRSSGVELAKLYRVHHFNLGRADQANHATLSVEPAAKLVTSKFATDFLATVRGFGTAAPVVLQWKLDDAPMPGGGSIRPDLQTPPQTQSNATFKTGGHHLITAALLGDDRLKVDDVRSRVVDVVSELKVLIVEGERGVGPMGGSASFLQLALAPPKQAGAGGPTNVRSDSYVAPDVISDLELGNKVLPDYRAVILVGVGQIPATLADQLQAYVTGGGTLILFMGEPVSADNYNGILLPRKLMPGPLTKRVTVDADQHGFSFDFNPEGVLHPYLSVFRGESKSGLDTAQIFTYWQVDLPPNSNVERVLDYLPRGERPTSGPAAPGTGGVPRDPAITNHVLGQGRVVFVSTTANAGWTSLPAKPAYVTLMHELLSGSVSSGDAWLNLTVGESLVVPPTLRLTAVPELIDPSRKPVAVQPTTVDGQTSYRAGPLLEPGVYTLSTGLRTMPVAVNVPADEADVRTLDDAAVRKALGDIEMTTDGDQLPAETASVHDGSDLGWSVMLIVLAMVALECFLAMRFGHYRRK